MNYSKLQKEIILDAMSTGIELYKHVDDTFSTDQMYQVMFGLEDNLDISKYARADVSLLEMRKERLKQSRALGLPYHYALLKDAEADIKREGSAICLDDNASVMALKYANKNEYSVFQTEINESNIEEVKELLMEEFKFGKIKSIFIMLPDNQDELVAWADFPKPLSRYLLIRLKAEKPCKRIEGAEGIQFISVSFKKGTDLKERYSMLEKIKTFADFE